MAVDLTESAMKVKKSRIDLCETDGTSVEMLALLCRSRMKRVERLC